MPIDSICGECGSPPTRSDSRRRQPGVCVFLTKRKGALYFGVGNKRGGDALVIEPVVVPKPAEMVNAAF